MRVADRLLLSCVSSDIVKRQIIIQQEPADENHKDKGVTKRKLPHFCYYRLEDTRVVVVNRKGKESPTTKSGTISRNVLAHLYKK